MLGFIGTGLITMLGNNVSTHLSSSVCSGSVCGGGDVAMANAGLLIGLAG